MGTEILDWIGALTDAAEERYGVGAAWLAGIAGIVLLVPLALLLSYWLG